MRKTVATVGVDVVAAIAAAAAAGAPGTDVGALTTGGGDAVAGEVTAAAEPSETTTAAPDEAIAGEVTAVAEPSETPGGVVAVVPTVYRINAIPAGGFCRAGRRWFREGEEVRREEFTDEQWAALVGEPMLSVVAL